jgi:hypothetical protein
MPVEHIPVGSAMDAGGTLACEQIKAASTRAPEGTRLVAALAPQTISVTMQDAELPKRWFRDASGITPSGAGSVSQDFTATAAGTYEVWLGGWSRGRTTLSVDGKPVGVLSQVLNETGAFATVGTLSLSAGTHTLTMSYSAPWWLPGSAGAADPLGPVMLSPSPDEHTVVEVSPADFNQLCGKRLDWLEIAH